MAEKGHLERLKILAYRTPDFHDPVIATFESYVNPSEIVLSYEIEYDGAQGAGTTGSRMGFKKAKPGDMSLSFFLDGTGANGRPIDVQEKIAEFQRVTGYNGDIHQTNYLKVVWGTLQVKRCVLKSASITYKLFRPSGVPLRATISAVFTDAVSDQARVAMVQDSSPDLTHVRTLRAGDSLAALCQEIYGDPHLVAKVARANGFDGFRQLPAGTRVRFPPLAN
jgi:phage tail protein X